MTVAHIGTRPVRRSDLDFEQKMDQASPSQSALIKQMRERWNSVAKARKLGRSPVPPEFVRAVIKLESYFFAR